MVFPKNCLSCGNEGSYICPVCLAKVKPARPRCSYCGIASINGVTHGRCTQKQGLDGLISVWEYEGVIRKALLALKYKYATEISSLVSGHIIKKLKSKGFSFRVPDSATLVPIPIYWYRQNTRGFNQSIEIGRVVAAQMGWKFAPDILTKRKSTVSQVELKGGPRRENLKGVFVVSPGIRIKKYPNPLLFDDVFTTGSTLHEAAQALKLAGIKEVWGLTIAR